MSRRSILVILLWGELLLNRGGEARLIGLERAVEAPHHPGKEGERGRESRSREGAKTT